MERLNLVKYLTQEAADIVSAAAHADAATAASMLDEAAELMNLGAGILSRGDVVAIEMKEAA